MSKLLRIRDIEEAIQNINHIDRITECFRRLQIPFKEEVYFATCGAGNVEVRITVGNTLLYFGNGKYMGIGDKLPEKKDSLQEAIDRMRRRV